MFSFQSLVSFLDNSFETMNLYSLLCIFYYPHSDPEEWPSTSSPTYKPTSSSLSVPLSSTPTAVPSRTASLPTPAHDGRISDHGQLSAMFALYEKIRNGSASVDDSEHYAGIVRQFG